MKEIFNKRIKKKILIFNAISWCNFMKKLSKILKISSQCEKCNREI